MRGGLSYKKFRMDTWEFRRASETSVPALPTGTTVADLSTLVTGFGAIHGQPGRRIESRRGAVAIGEAFGETGQGGDRAVAVDPADAVVVAGIGRVQRAVRGHRHAIRIIETRLRDRPVAHPAHAIARRESQLRGPAERRRRRTEEIGSPWCEQEGGGQGDGGQRHRDPQPGVTAHAVLQVESEYSR